MGRIRNASVIGMTPARRDALALIEAGLDAIDTEAVVRRSVALTGDRIVIGGQVFPLADYRSVRIIGCGKAACDAAAAMEDILGDRVTSGTIIGTAPGTCERITTVSGTHPRPSLTNVQATERLITDYGDLPEDDLVIVIVSGGGSALLCWPMTECDQGARLYHDAVAKGLTIHELNTVRKHISHIKGGGLAEILHPARVVGLIFSDVPGPVPGPVHHMVASGPTYPDLTTVADAQAVLDRYGLTGYELNETPKDERYFERVTNTVVVSNVVALRAMQEAARARGYRPAIVADHVYADPKDVLQMLMDYDGNHDLLLAGGEFRLVVPAHSGRGGRNTNASLVALERIRAGELFVAFASDGCDNTDAAGAIADDTARTKARQRELDTADFAARFDDYSFFEKTGDLIFTGATGSNVSDLMLYMKAR
jgi:glycerate-2-kinase